MKSFPPAKPCIPHSAAWKTGKSPPASRFPAEPPCASTRSSRDTEQNPPVSLGRRKSREKTSKSPNAFSSLLQVVGNPVSPGAFPRPSRTPEPGRSPRRSFFHSAIRILQSAIKTSSLCAMNSALKGAPSKILKPRFWGRAHIGSFCQLRPRLQSGIYILKSELKYLRSAITVPQLQPESIKRIDPHNGRQK